ncbi:hypothetical protein AU05_25270 [Ectopseudomonas composti]|uniref:ABC-three component systems C-terminal domain-containing protein n=1 Tax=Ectopseudomonas composti TaxID=658457 RepID=A0ABN0S6U8_9GAMM|nr:ABC-three component system protein [Pseudomonas composti]EZH77245.1 hypothetical protein AU05_25270 [Pseudomonas composti]
MAFDASPSWSGFNYQGKIAVYYALQVINSQPVDFNFSSYSLILENTEDFEISVDGNPISFHQVKAYQKHSFSEYSEALVGISLELYKSPEANGYLHSWKAVNNKAGKSSVAESISAVFAGIVEEYQSCHEKKGETIIEQAASNKKKLDKLASIVRLALPQKSEQQLIAILQELALNNNPIIRRFHLYQYPNGSLFCDLNDVELLIKSELQTSFANRGMPITGRQIDNSFHYFLGEIDRHIIARHKNESGKPIPIPFQEILDILFTNFEDVSKDHFACEFKNIFMNKFHDYMDDEELYTLSTDQHCNLKAIQSILCELPPGNLWEHYRHFAPHKYVHPHNNMATAFEADFEGILFGLLKIFHSINSQKNFHDLPRNLLTYRSFAPRPTYYLPTVISGEYSPQKIAREILKNPHMTESLFEINKLIYRGKCIEKLPSHATEHTDPPQEIDADTRAKRTQIMESLSLISIEAAKGELNAD